MEIYFPKKLLNNQRLELDKRLLENFYKNKGYYDVEIISDTVKYQDDQNFEIVFNIDSGKNITLENLSLISQIILMRFILKKFLMN